VIARNASAPHHRVSGGRGRKLGRPGQSPGFYSETPTERKARSAPGIGDNSLAALAERIRAEHEATAAAMHRGCEHAIAAGRLLIEAKALLRHGEWLPWLQEHCQVSDRTARLYMRLARHAPELEANRQRVADLTVRAALDALAPVALPDIGRGRLGRRYQQSGDALDMVGIVASEKHPGFFHVGHVELTTGVHSWLRRPIAGDVVGRALDLMAPDGLGEFEWEDHRANCNALTHLTGTCQATEPAECKP
jgi:Protein of unknown function (DUF3102)